MTNPTLERAARAAGDQVGEYEFMLANKQEWIQRRGINHAGEPVDINGPFQDDFIDIARAVLMAVREPGYTMSERDFNRRLDVIRGEDNDQYSA